MTRTANPDRPDAPQESQPQKHQRLDLYLELAPPDTPIPEIVAAWRSDKKPREVWPDD